MAKSKIMILEQGNGERLEVFGAGLILKSDASLNSVFLAEHPIPPGYFVPPHIHESDTEIFFVLEGELTLLGDEGELSAGPGATVILPPGIPHGFRNDTDGMVRFLVLCAPAQKTAAMFRGFAAAGNAPPDHVAAIAAQHGVTMLMPG